MASRSIRRKLSRISSFLTCALPVARPRKLSPSWRSAKSSRKPPRNIWFVSSRTMMWIVQELTAPSPPQQKFLARALQRRLVARSSSNRLIIVFGAKMGNQFLAHHPTQRVLQFHGLNEQIVLGIKFRRAHRRLEIKAQPFLNPAHPRALRQVEE